MHPDVSLPTSFFKSKTKKDPENQKNMGAFHVPQQYQNTEMLFDYLIASVAQKLADLSFTEDYIKTLNFGGVGAREHTLAQHEQHFIFSRKGEFV